MEFDDCMNNCDPAWTESDLVVAGGYKVMLDRVEVNRMEGMTAACNQSVNLPQPFKL